MEQVRKGFIAMTGKAGAGKDHIADYIIDLAAEDLDLVGVKIPWARAVRQEIEHELGDVFLPELYKKPTSYAVRRLLQFWGTDFRRAEDPDYWVKRGLEAADASYADFVVFSDTRFPNEVDAVLERGGHVILVEATEETRIERIGVVPEHASEAGGLPYTLKVDNNAWFAPQIPVEVFDYLRGVR